MQILPHVGRPLFRTLFVLLICPARGAVSREKEIRVADLCLFVTRLQLREIAIQPPDLWTYSNEGEFYKRQPVGTQPSSSPLGSTYPLKFASLL